MPQLRVPLRRLALALSAALAIPLIGAIPAQAASPNLVISQVYGGGGNSGAPLTHDFIEIYNRGDAAVNLGTYSLQYGSATGTGAIGANSGQLTELPAVMLDPGEYFLVQEGAGAGSGIALPEAYIDPTPISMSASGGKVVLVTGTTGLGCNGGSIVCTAEQLARIVDLVGYGTANFFETSPAPELSNTTAAIRAAGGEQDTDNNSADFTAVAPDPRNTGNVVTAVDDAPDVASTAPDDGTFSATPSGNLTVTFSEPVSLATGAVGLTCAGDAVGVTVTGGPSTFTVDPAVDLPVGMTCTGTVDAEGVSDQDANDPPDGMTADFAWSFVVASACGDPATPISTVQGSGMSSPMDGEPVTIEAVVTADRTGSSRLRGFWVEEELDDRDSDVLSSEGIFVFGSLPAGAAEGDVVRVSGEVDERFDHTQISATSVQTCSLAASLPAPAEVTLPLSTDTYLERFEGMVVTFAQDLVISEYFNYDRFGETVVGLPPNGWDRFHTPTAVVEPGTLAQELAAEYELRQILLDDGRSSQNPTPAYFPGTVDTPLTTESSFRGGDTLTNVTGVLAYDFGVYRVHPTHDATYSSENPRPTDAPDVGGSIQVASFNVLNYFLTGDAIQDDSGTNNPSDDVCGGNADLECRGFDTNQPTELERQRTKIIAAIGAMDAEVVGLMEMENTPGVEPAADLVAGLNEIYGAGTYAYIDTGVIGTDAIRLGFLYQPGEVTPVGDFAILDSGVDPRFIDTRNRPALAQTFEENATGELFTVTVNHLKSKGSACSGDPDSGDGSGNCNETRTQAAEALADWLATDPTGSGDPDHLIIGDLNSYDHEDPIDALVAAGYTDLVKLYGGEYAYGYVFDAAVGYLDHALANHTLVHQVTGAQEWHINADEPDILDYDTSFKQPNEEALYEPTPYRSSDHDPVLVGLSLGPVVPENCYTDGRQTVEFFKQGLRRNGTAVPPAMSDPSNALGLSDPSDADPYWVALGLSGEIVIEFASPVRDTNGAAADLRIVGAADGARGSGDRADVYVSFDGETWVLAGTVSGTGELDIPDPLISAQYVKVVDTTPNRGPASTDGYDLDAIEVLSGCAR